LPLFFKAKLVHSTRKWISKKDEILETQQSALKSIQDATETLEGRMVFLEHEYQNSKTTTNHDADEELSTPTKKRRKKTKQQSFASSSTRGSGNHGDDDDGDDYSCPRVAACEAQLQEQRSQIAALRAMITSMNPPTPAAATLATTTTTATAMPQIKLEHEDEEEGQILESTTAAAAAAPPKDDDNEKNAMLATMEQELHRVQQELVASQETANRYKMKCEYYKDRMEQLGKLLKFQP
jgi:hypothetical protein